MPFPSIFSVTFLSRWQPGVFPDVGEGSLPCAMLFSLRRASQHATPSAHLRNTLYHHHSQQISISNPLSHYFPKRTLTRSDISKPPAHASRAPHLDGSSRKGPHLGITAPPTRSPQHPRPTLDPILRKSPAIQLTRLPPNRTPRTRHPINLPPSRLPPNHPHLA